MSPTPITESKRAGWILVGGRSSRMGADKAFLEVDGRALALRVADRVLQVCPTVSLVGDPVRYRPLGLPVISEDFAGEGPLSGIEAALRHSPSGSNLIVACDMPALDVPILEALFAADGDCAVPRYPDGNVEPLCAVYHRRCHAAIRSALEAGVRKVTDALRPPLQLRYVPVPSRAPFANLNTPEDLRKYTHA